MTSHEQQQGNIPQKYKDLLQNVLNQMESETGDMYQFTVNKFGNPSNYNFIIGKFTNRNMKIQVYDMELEFKDLEGLYDSRDCVIAKIKEFRTADLFEETKESIGHNGQKYIIGKCKFCHSYNDKISNRMPNTIGSNCCQNSSCHKSLFSKWDNLHIDSYSNTLYTSDGGSLSICDDVGKYKFIN